MAGRKKSASGDISINFIEKRCPQSIRMITKLLKNCSVGIESDKNFREMIMCFDNVKEICAYMKKLQKIAKDVGDFSWKEFFRFFPFHVQKRIFPNLKAFKRDLQQCCDACRANLLVDQFYQMEFLFANDKYSNVILKPFFDMKGISEHLLVATFTYFVHLLAKQYLKLIYIGRDLMDFYTAISFCMILWDYTTDVIAYDNPAWKNVSGSIHALMFLTARAFFYCTALVLTFEHVNCPHCLQVLIMHVATFGSTTALAGQQETVFSDLDDVTLEMIFLLISSGIDLIPSSELETYRGICYLLFWLANDINDCFLKAILHLEARNNVHLMALAYYERACRSSDVEEFSDSVNESLHAAAFHYGRIPENVINSSLNNILREFSRDLVKKHMTLHSRRQILSTIEKKSGSSVLAVIHTIVPKNKLHVDDWLAAQSINIGAVFFCAKCHSLSQEQSESKASELVDRWENALKFLWNNSVAANAITAFLNELCSLFEKRLKQLKNSSRAFMEVLRLVSGSDDNQTNESTAVQLEEFIRIETAAQMEEICQELTEFEIDEYDAAVTKQSNKRKSRAKQTSAKGKKETTPSKETQNKSFSGKKKINEQYDIDKITLTATASSKLFPNTCMSSSTRRSITKIAFEKTRQFSCSENFPSALIKKRTSENEFEWAHEVVTQSKLAEVFGIDLTEEESKSRPREPEVSDTDSGDQSSSACGSSDTNQKAQSSEQSDIKDASSEKVTAESIKQIAGLNTYDDYDEKDDKSLVMEQLFTLKMIETIFERRTSHPELPKNITFAKNILKSIAKLGSSIRSAKKNAPSQLVSRNQYSKSNVTNVYKFALVFQRTWENDDKSFREFVLKMHSMLKMK